MVSSITGEIVGNYEISLFSICYTFTGIQRISKRSKHHHHQAFGSQLNSSITLSSGTMVLD